MQEYFEQADDARIMDRRNSPLERALARFAAAIAAKDGIKHAAGA